MVQSNSICAISKGEKGWRASGGNLYRPIQEPADLKQGNRTSLNSHRTCAISKVRKARKAALLAKMKTARPRGIWAWVTGKIRAHDRVMKLVDTKYDEIVEKLGALGTALWRAEGRVKLGERSWRGQRREIEAGRARKRAEIADELLWLADARACIVKDIGVAVSPAALEDAIKELRAERAKQRIADRPPVLRFTSSRSYRPHFSGLYPPFTT